MHTTPRTHSTHLSNCTVFVASALAAVALFASGCGSSETDSDEGNVTVGTYSFHVEQEGSFATGGNAANYAIKPNSGVAKPDLVQCWYGEQADTDHASGVYDSGDGDFDCAPQVAAAPPADAMLWIAVTYAGVVSTASLNVTK